MGACDSIRLALALGCAELIATIDLLIGERTNGGGCRPPDRWRSRVVVQRARRKRGHRNLIVVAALALLIAGFLTRRILAPPGAGARALNDSQPSATGQRGTEPPSDQERRELDAIVRGQNR